MNTELKNNVNNDSEKIVDNNSEMKMVEDKVEKTVKEQFDEKIEGLKENNDIKNIQDLFIELESALNLKKIDDQYFKYATQYIADTYFSKIRGSQLSLKVIIEKVYPDVNKIQENNINFEDINIVTIGTHTKNDRLIEDNICLYGKKLVSVFGVYEDDQFQYESYEKQTYIQPNMMESIKRYIDSSEKVNIEKYEDYYVVRNAENESVQMYKEKIETALIKNEESGIEKIKSKLYKIFGFSIFAKKRFLSNMEKIYDTNADIIEDILQERKTKENAKNRMKVLLQAERKLNNDIREQKIN